METHFYVYMTTNLINGKSYIGKRAGRLDDNYMGSGTHLNSAIQKYGKDNFKKAILEVCDSDDHSYEREAYWVEFYDAVKSPNFYNLCGGGVGTGSGENHPCYGKPLSDEHRRKISENHAGYWKGKTHSDETKRKMSEVKASHKNPFYGQTHTNEWKRKMSEAKKGKTHSDETKRKMSESKQNISDETRRKMSEAAKGRKASDEVRKKLSEARKGDKNNFYGKRHLEESKRKMSEAAKNRSAETRRKMSEAQKGKRHSEESKRKMSESRKGNNLGTKNPMYKSRPDITNEFLKSIICNEPSIKLSDLLGILNIGRTAFSRIIRELFNVNTFTELKKLFQ
jgi:group I intron endonuclease